jgi:hypothetical protein
MEQPLVLTYDNAPTANTEFFIETLKQNKWNYTLLGQGELWKGFQSKMRGYMDALHNLPKKQVVVVSDARDVVCVRPPNYFKDGLMSFGGKIVVSMELFCEGHMDEEKVEKKVQCIPLTEYWKYYGITLRPTRKFANSGLIAGYAEDVYHLFSWILSNNFSDDQLGLCNYINTFPEKIYADTGAVLLHTSGFGVNCGTLNLKIQSQDSPGLSTILGGGAFFLHIPGLNHSKGQIFVYSTVVSLLKSLGGQKLTDAYNYSPLKWNESIL